MCVELKYKKGIYYVFFFRRRLDHLYIICRTLFSGGVGWCHIFNILNRENLNFLLKYIMIFVFP